MISPLRVFGLAALGALAVHGAFAVRVGYIHAELIGWTDGRLASFVASGMARAVVVDTLEPAPPPKDDAPAPPKVRVAPAARAPRPPVAAVRTQSAPTARAAQAVPIVAAPPDGPVDLTNGFVSGLGARSLGGLARRDGSSASPVRDSAKSGDATAGSTRTTAPPVDRSRPLEREGGGDWKCPFPAEADVDAIDDAAAVITVTVAADGKLQSATIDQDPGHGFGREARACALRESWVPALDRDGKPVLATKRLRVLFSR